MRMIAVENQFDLMENIGGMSLRILLRMRRTTFVRKLLRMRRIGSYYTDTDQGSQFPSSKMLVKLATKVQTV